MSDKYHNHTGVKGSHLSSIEHKDPAAKKAHDKEATGVSTVVAKTKKSALPQAIKDMNTELTKHLNTVFELRKQKHAGKDVKDELKKELKFLKDGREKKKEKMTELGL